MTYKNIEYSTRNSIGILTINRPKALNALNSQTIVEIRSLLAEIKSGGEIRVLIITGSGEKAFVAGADIGEVNGLSLKDGYEFFRKGLQLHKDLEDLGFPTIAAINGLALGGGCELALACSLRIVSENAKLGLPELSLGVIPGYGGTQRLARLIGKGRTLWFLLTGEMIDASSAVEMGLANLMVKPEMLIDRTVAVAEKIASKSPFAIKMALLAVNHGLETSLDTGLILESALGNLAVGSKDKIEGITAFLEKRKPEFKGE
ncbi:MAG: enoyl-CoA hydratase-related protein [Pseudomonadota bacterium]